MGEMGSSHTPFKVYVDTNTMVDYAVAGYRKATYSGRNFSVQCTAGQPSNAFLALMVVPVVLDTDGQRIDLPFWPVAVQPGDTYSLNASVPLGPVIGNVTLVAVACWAWGVAGPPIVIVQTG
jgi:hypothetical protein